MFSARTQAMVIPALFVALALFNYFQLHGPAAQQSLAPLQPWCDLGTTPPPPLAEPEPEAVAPPRHPNPLCKRYTGVAIADRALCLANSRLAALISEPSGVGSAYAAYYYAAVWPAAVWLTLTELPATLALLAIQGALAFDGAVALPLVAALRAALPTSTRSPHSEMALVSGVLGCAWPALTAYSKPDARTLTALYLAPIRAAFIMGAWSLFRQFLPASPTSERRARNIGWALVALASALAHLTLLAPLLMHTGAVRTLLVPIPYETDEPDLQAGVLAHAQREGALLTVASILFAGLRARRIEDMLGLCVGFVLAGPGAGIAFFCWRREREERTDARDEKKQA